MNFLDKIEPFLVSEDLITQDFILHILDDYPYVPAEWTERLLKEALLSKEKETSILIHASKLPLSDEVMKVLIEGLQKADPSKLHLYLSFFDNVEPEMALAHQMELEKYIAKDEWDFYRFLLEGSEEEVWEEYGAALGKLESSSKFNHKLYVRAKQLAKRIVKNGWIDENEIDLNLQEQLRKEYFTMDGILIVYIIGLMKLPKYIPFLASLLDRDEDILLEEIADTLVSFQSDEVVEMVLPYAKKEESSIFAISILSGTKTSLSTKVLKELLVELEDEEDQSLVFEALCHQLSADALPEIEQYMKNDPISYMIDIEQTVYGFYSVMGEDYPKLNNWKKTVAEKEAEYRKPTGNGLFAGTPILNNEKVGRNDPCTCGSGKKYKKCCGA
jgi:hypothetical protein